MSRADIEKSCSRIRAALKVLEVELDRLRHENEKLTDEGFLDLLPTMINQLATGIEESWMFNERGDH
jgi:hypothetical protein